MTHALTLFALTLACAPDDPDAGHAANALYRELLAEGVGLGGARFLFPPPRVRDGQTAAEQRKALAELAGGETALDDLLRDSVTAPFLLKVRDEATAGGDPVRRADLYFAVHGDIDAIDPAEAARRSSGKTIEVANMRFETSLLTADALGAAGIPAPDPARDWYAHVSARLLDRLRVEATDHVVVSRSKDSWVVAARTDARFGTEGVGANVWNPLGRDGRPVGDARSYPGGASYTRISRMAGAPGTLFVESHFAFNEPRAWFDGAPILRSKFSPIAQDQIRRLRRDVKASPRTSNAGPER